MQEKIESPCIRDCCLNQDDVCLGCFRHIDEIVGWQARTEKQKKIILINCQNRKLSHTESDNNKS